MFTYILLWHFSLTPWVAFDRQIKTGKNRMVPIFKSNKECQHGPSRGNVMMDAEEAIRVDPVDNFIKKVG
jgi:hypothetical protein